MHCENCYPVRDECLAELRDGIARLTKKHALELAWQETVSEEKDKFFFWEGGFEIVLVFCRFPYLPVFFSHYKKMVFFPCL